MQALLQHWFIISTIVLLLLIVFQERMLLALLVVSKIWTTVSLSLVCHYLRIGACRCLILKILQPPSSLILDPQALPALCQFLLEQKIVFHGKNYVWQPQQFITFSITKARFLPVLTENILLRIRLYSLAFRGVSHWRWPKKLALNPNHSPQRS